MSDTIEDLERVIKGMEKNLDGLLPLTFGFYYSKAGTILNQESIRQHKDYQNYRTRYDSIVKQAIKRGIIQ